MPRETIDSLRTRVQSLLARVTHETMKAELRDISDDLDGASDSLERNKADPRPHIYLSAADIKTELAAQRLAAVEDAVRDYGVDVEVRTHDTNE
jgi:hypothetical protein